MIRRGFALLAGMGLCLSAIVQADAPAVKPPLSPSPKTASPLPATPVIPTSSGSELTKPDVDGWLDGFMPYALASGDVAGGIVVVVKDGQVLTQRGYGYADIAKRKKVDPATTMFRVGSTSKLFTWTAVMQLVEQRKIDLDADVNRYIDFKIPPFDGKPITMRNIMTHTPGFEEVVKGGFSYSGKVEPLGVVVKRLLPERVYEPGSTPAYSNYATALAGYIVERVSGEPFDSYVERHIFRPLGMDHSSFRQPLPSALAPYMATGYDRASGEAKPFELISVPPAGSLSMSGADGAKFMIAHLANGAGLMKPETAILMHKPAYGTLPGLNRMALGFYEQRINDVDAIAHGGDLINFHGYMWLLPAQNVGLLLEMNSAGAEEATARIREALFERFADRYFPKSDARPPAELPTAREHANMLAGSYINSRGEFTTFLDIGNLIGQTVVGIVADGRPLVPEFTGSPPRKWIEVAPFAWQDAYGHARLGAEVRDGKVVRWSVNELSPFTVFDRAPWYRDAAWLLPLFELCLSIVAIAALYWPASAVIRRRFGAAFGLAGRDAVAYRLALAFSALTIAAFACWAYVILVHLESLSTADGPILLARIVGSVAFIALPIATGWNLLQTWPRTKKWSGKISAALLFLASLVIFWVTFDFHLIGLGTRF